jgi:hypothetical protein
MSIIEDDMNMYSFGCLEELTLSEEMQDFAIQELSPNEIHTSIASH